MVIKRLLFAVFYLLWLIPTFLAGIFLLFIVIPIISPIWIFNPELFDHCVDYIYDTILDWVINLPYNMFDIDN